MVRKGGNLSLTLHLSVSAMIPLRELLGTNGSSQEGAAEAPSALLLTGMPLI